MTFLPKEEAELSTKSSSVKTILTFPIEISATTCSKLWIGSVDVAMNYYPKKTQQTQETNVGLIINVAKRTGKDKSEVREKMKIEYLTLSENSDISALSRVCEKAFPLIYETLFNQQKNVIIHCSEGKTRSPTLGYLFLIYGLGWESSKAQSYFKACKLMSCILTTSKNADHYFAKLKLKTNPDNVMKESAILLLEIYQREILLNLFIWFCEHFKKTFSTFF
ncbi:hypothetical protein RFI_31517 [Reticulomyxa filosa]|uniref:protein-tyrosine-phosphatase n=1 Tax=Reticulomyxa filosa TaxID=46433 RepID=X6LX27_RETFI|nr:hypothetical protein RFI_31517 [Reticulomyxa filosa]|eukprot:ETO05876.1 hypothetical protein RFI_31517 [Reticulomyxa filosa]